MNNIAIIRVPSQSAERDPSAKAIENLTTISKEFFDCVITFESRFSNNGTEVVDITRRISNNIFLNIIYLIIYQLQLSYALYMRRSNLEMVFLHAGGFLFVLPIIVCKLLRIRVVVSVIGEPHKGYQNVSSGHIIDKILTNGVLLAERFAYSAADVIAVFSMDMMSYSLLTGKRSKCTRVRFNFETVPDDVPNLSERDISVVYLGRICKLKGADCAAEAVKHLSSNPNVDVTASFIGNGNILDELQDEYKEQISFTGWVPQETVSEYLANSKILILPSQSEGLPKALLEAMSVGVVPVVTPVGNIPSVVEDGENGVLIDDPTPERIAEIIHQLLVSDDLNTLSQNAQETIASEYSFEAATEDFEKLLQTSEA